jgi:hypothetical protein
MKTARRVRKGACGKRPVATPAPRPRAYLATPSRPWGADRRASNPDSPKMRVTHRLVRRRAALARTNARQGGKQQRSTDPATEHQELSNRPPIPSRRHPNRLGSLALVVGKVRCGELVDLAPVSDIQDQDDEPVVVHLVENSPVTDPDAPGAGIAYQSRGLTGVRILGKPVDDFPDPRLDCRI